MKKKYFYPRKCDHCDYVSNNPVMFGYHKQIHVPIPEGTLCSLGCGQLAKFRKTKSHVCQENSHHCPAYIEKHSQLVKQQWKDNEWSERRAKVATVRQRLTPEQNKKHDEDQVRTKRLKRIATETTKGQRAYSRAIIYHSRKTYNENKHILNPENLLIGRGGNFYSLDHKVSKHVGWLLKIPVDVMSSIHNLQVIPMKQNSSKSIKCSLEPEKLFELIKAGIL